MIYFKENSDIKLINFSNRKKKEETIYEKIAID